MDASQVGPEAQSSVDHTAASVSPSVFAPPTIPVAALSQDRERANLPVNEASSGGLAASISPLDIVPLQVNKACKLSAPRPPASFRKGLKVESSGSTILRHKLGDCKGHGAATAMCDRPTRSVNEQPCTYARPTAKPMQCLPRGWYKTTIKRDATPKAPSIKLGAKWGTGGAAKFPRSSYVVNPPGTRPKSSMALRPKDVVASIQPELWGSSGFRRAWADMSDSSEEELVACELPQLLPQAASSPGRTAIAGLSRRTYKRFKQYAFWKIRKVHGGHSKDSKPCSAYSTESQSVNPLHDSSRLLCSVDESAPQQGNHTPGNVADSVTQGQAPGASQGNEAVSRCILNAVWSRLAVRGPRLILPNKHKSTFSSQHLQSLQSLPKNGGYPSSGFWQGCIDATSARV